MCLLAISLPRLHVLPYAWCFFVVLLGVISCWCYCSATPAQQCYYHFTPLRFSLHFAVLFTARSPFLPAMAFLVLELLRALERFLPPDQLAPLLAAAVRAFHAELATTTVRTLRLAHGTSTLDLVLYCGEQTDLDSFESIVEFLQHLENADDLVERAFARARAGALLRLVRFLAQSFARAPALSAVAAPAVKKLARAVGAWTHRHDRANDDNEADDNEADDNEADYNEADDNEADYNFYNEAGYNDADRRLFSSDPVFSRLYRLFSPLARHNAWNLQCARAMVAVYTAARSVRLAELESVPFHTDAVCAFLVPLLPRSLRHSAESILRHQLHPSLGSTSPAAQPAQDPTGPTNAIHTIDPVQHPAPESPADLASNLDAVVSILNEYDLDFDPLFPHRFRHFLFLVHHDLPSCTCAADYDYITRVASIVNEIIDFDTSPAKDSSLVRAIVHDLHLMQFHLLRQLTLLMRLALREVESLHQVVKSAFSVWNSRLLDAAQLQVLCDEDFLPRRHRVIFKRCFSVWYNKSTRFRLLQAQAADYSDKRLAAKYLNSYWIQKLLAIARAEAQSDAFRLRPALRVWKSRYLSIQALNQQLCDYIESKTLATAFSALRIRQKALNYLDSLALDFYSQSLTKSETALVKHTMAMWTHKFALQSGSTSDLLSEKLSELGLLGLAFIARKYFLLWHRRCTLFEIAGQFEKKSHTRIKQKNFSLWKFRLQSRNLSGSLVVQRDLRLLSKALKSWKLALDDRRKASVFAEKSRLILAFKLWKLNLQLVTTEVPRQRRLLELSLTKWNLAKKAQLFRQKTEENLKVQAFQAWVKVYQTQGEKITRSSKVYDRNLLRQTLSGWESLLALNRELAVVANLNLQRKFLHILASKSAMHQQRGALADQLLKNGKTFDERLISAFYLRNWKDKYVKRYEDISRKAANDFESKVRNKNTLRVFFGYWNRKLRQLSKRMQILEQRLHSSSSFNEMGRIYLLHWCEKVVFQREAMEKSASFYTTLLHKKYLLAWYEKYVTKVDYLLDISDELRNQKDYICLLDNLRKWNLNLIKHVKRNNQTCTMFREKWEKANMKSLFQLWLHKTRQRELMLVDGEDEEYVEANTTFGSNLSPLSRKYPQTGSTSMFDTTSYLNTPVKKQVQGLFTPQNRKGPSPTRLQETNQRMKIDKMDALINHYKLAKKLSNVDGRLSKAVRLSPPRLNYIPSHIPIKPPAPRFETHSSSSSPEATSSPGLSVGEPETSLLNTAKKLKKIKPLVIPPQRENEFRLTSVSKLRARLQARGGSDIGSSNVFDDTS